MKILDYDHVSCFEFLAHYPNLNFPTSFNKILKQEHSYDVSYNVNKTLNSFKFQNICICLTVYANISAVSFRIINVI
jgi:hypothetical protein